VFRAIGSGHYRRQREMGTLAAARNASARAVDEFAPGKPRKRVRDILLEPATVHLKASQPELRAVAAVPPNHWLSDGVTARRQNVRPCVQRLGIVDRTIVE